MDIDEIKEKYLYIFSDCFLVKGFTRTMIFDISKRRIFFVNNSYYDLIENYRNHTIGSILIRLENQDDIKEYSKFIDYILKNDLGAIVDDIKRFPKINIEWDAPYDILNAIIDIRNKIHPFKKIFYELDQLNCPYIQIRVYRSISAKELNVILSDTKNCNFRHIELILKSNNEHSYNEYIEILQQFPLCSIVFHSQKKSISDAVIQKLRLYGIQFTAQEIISNECCGIINKESLALRDLQGFIENMKYNSCLNRKISIDEEGNIKNCPSMKYSFGHIEKISLQKIYNREDFTKVGQITKDQIDVCKDCEYRYVCSDCRAIVSEPNNLYSKPKKCGYDPYKGKWE